MTAPSRDPSIFDEPHMRGAPFAPQPDDVPEARSRRGDSEPGAVNEERQAEHGVWDEPGLSPELAGAPPGDQLTYGRWLARGRERTGAAASWVVTLLVALVAGPWAVLGVLLGGGQTFFQIVAVVLIAPVAEETMKIAAATYVVEKRPFLFSSAAQIVICGLAGGLVFAALENVLYLTVYVSHPSGALVWWRWTVCVALHMGCSAISSLGLARVWRGVWERRRRARLAAGFAHLLVAVSVHGAYNLLATVFSVAGGRF